MTELQIYLFIVSDKKSLGNAFYAGADDGNAKNCDDVC